MKSFINLFKAVIITEKKKKKPSKKLLEETIKRGFIFSPEVVFNHTEDQLLRLIPIIEEVFGISGSQLNMTFHKSWSKIRDASMLQLVIEQIIHYITTYGFEELGIYDSHSVYIPEEKLKIPKINMDKIPLVVIRGYTKEEFKDKLFLILKSGIALFDQTKNDVINVTTFLGFEEKEISQIKNKEVRVALYDYLGLIPSNPIEFLRFVIYKTIEKTLLIKDETTIAEIKSRKNISTSVLFKKYDKQYGFKNLAEIFYRFKPLFLAFRTNLEMKVIINQIRRMAKIYHKPMPEDFLNNVTANIKHGKLDLTKLEKELSKVNIFRKVRLAYALKFRTCCPENIMYKIRNGKSFITYYEMSRAGDYDEVLDIILESIAKDLKPKVAKKKIYIPKTITYTLPATEKQFIGNFPSGTCVTVPKNMIFGIHWFDVGQTRIDLDLSLINNHGEKLGWDAYYRNEARTIMFSGDMTAAPKPNGATELFYINSNSNINGIMYVNYYNYNEKVEVPFKIVVASAKLSHIEENYMINPNNLISSDSTKINTQQKILGLLVTNAKECKFYYVESSLGKSITSKISPLTEKARQFLFDFYFGTITLNEVLEKAGAIMVESNEKCDLDLSPEALEKDTIIKLIS